MDLPKSLSILRKFGRQPLTGKDFIRLCSLNRITLKITPDCDRGFYYCLDGEHYIALSSEMTGPERLFVGWHEFAHFLQNRADRRAIAAFSNVQPNKASEKLADVFAYIACDPGWVTITGPQDFVKMIMRTKIY